MKDSKHIINSLLKTRQAARMGCCELIWTDTLKKWCSQGMPYGDDNKPVNYHEHFQLDMYPVDTWFDILPIRGCEEIIEESDRWIIKRNGAGAVLKQWKEKSGVPEHIDFRMTSRKVWEKDYRHHLLELDKRRIDTVSIKNELAKRRKQGFWTHYGHMFVFESLRRSIGDLCLYESVLTDPDWIHDYNRVYTEFFKRHYEHIFCNSGFPDGIWVYEDLGYKNTTFCSPGIYQELFFPYYNELIDFFHSFGLPVILHSCGFIEQLIPAFIKLGFDALNPLEVKSGCDPLRFAQMYGSKIALVGGFDVRLLETKDRDLIKHEIMKIIDCMKKYEVRYIFASDHSISTAVDYQDYQYALNVFKENMFC